MICVGFPVKPPLFFCFKKRNPQNTFIPTCAFLVCKKTARRDTTKELIFVKQRLSNFDLRVPSGHRPFHTTYWVSRRVQAKLFSIFSFPPTNMSLFTQSPFLKRKVVFLQRHVHKPMLVESQLKPGTKIIDPEPCKELRRRRSAAIYGWDRPLLTFI